MAEFIVTTPDSRETVNLNEFPLLIGRHKENDLVYDDQQLSRRHCVIKREENQLFIEDLDSKNGTYVNGKETSRTILNDGDQIEIGDVHLRLRQDPYELEQQSTGGEQSATASREDRIVPWINPFQITSDSSPGRSGSFCLGIIVTGFLIVLLFGGYLLLQPLHPDEETNNILTRTGAWTGTSDGWNLNGASFGSEGNYSQVLALQTSDENRSFARHKRLLSVDPSSTYTLSARLSTRNLKGLAGAHITWIGGDGNARSEQLVLPLTAEKQPWLRRTSAPLAPPEGTTKMRLSFFSAGEQGTVLVHKPILRKHFSLSEDTNSANTRLQTSLDPFPLHVDASGQLVSRNANGGQLLQSGLRFRRNDTVTSGWTTSVMNRKEKQNTLHWTGTAFTPITFQPVYFTLKLEKRPRPTVTYALPTSVLDQVNDVGFRFRYRARDLPTNLGVLTSNGLEKTPPGQSREQALGFQLPLGNEPIIFEFTRPLTVQYRRGSGNTLVVDAFASASSYSSEQEARKPNRINVGLSLLKTQPENNEGKALTPSPPPNEVEDMIKSAAYEKALGALQKLQPFDRFQSKGPAYHRLHDRLQNRIQQDRSEIQRTIETARNLNSQLLVKRARELLKQLTQKLGPYSDRFQLAELNDLLTSAEKALSRDRNQDEARVRELYNRFKKFRDSGQNELASEFAEELVQQNANDTARQEARTFLDQNQNAN